MKTENFDPENIDDILKGYQVINNQKNKAKKLFQKRPTEKNKKIFQKYHEEWLKFRDEYKAVLQASIVKTDK